MQFRGLRSANKPRNGSPEPEKFALTAPMRANTDKTVIRVTRKPILASLNRTTPTPEKWLTERPGVRYA